MRHRSEVRHNPPRPKPKPPVRVAVKPKPVISRSRSTNTVRAAVPVVKPINKAVSYHNSHKTNNIPNIVKQEKKRLPVSYGNTTAVSVKVKQGEVNYSNYKATVGGVLQGAVKSKLTYRNLINHRFKSEGAYNPVRGSLLNKVKGVCEEAKEKSGRGDVLHGNVITAKDVNSFIDNVGKEFSKFINNPLKYTGEVVKEVAKFIDKNLENIGKGALLVGGIAVVAGAGALAAGAMPVIVIADLGITVTGSAIAGASIKVAGVSALLGAGAGGAQVLSGAVKRDLVLDRLTEEESKTRISNGLNNVVGSIMIGTSVYMLNNAYNTYTIKQAGNKINSDSNAYASETAKSQNTQLNSSSGQWVKVNENMSETSKKYQSQITGHTDEVWLQNGVKFDGYKDGVLIDAKGHYNQFINKNTGQFYDWFNGEKSLIKQAEMQFQASKGIPIEWYFAEKESMNVIYNLFLDEGINYIRFIHEPLK